MINKRAIKTKEQLNKILSLMDKYNYEYTIYFTEEGYFINTYQYKRE